MNGTLLQGLIICPFIYFVGVISIRILCLSYPYIIESTDSMIKRGVGEDSAGEGCMFCGSVPLSLSSGGGGGGGGGMCQLSNEHNGLTNHLRKLKRIATSFGMSVRRWDTRLA